MKSHTAMLEGRQYSVYNHRERPDQSSRSPLDLKRIVLIVLVPLMLVPLTPGVLAARPGCYTDYFFDEPGPFESYEIFLTWDLAPQPAWIYPAFTFGFEAGTGGYTGTQIVGNERKVLFSIWDIEENAGTAVPLSSNARRFSGEGTGAQCPLTYNWVDNREYKLRIWLDRYNSSGQIWCASIQDTVTSVETEIGEIYLKNSRGFVGYGRLMNGPSIFLEYFGGPDSPYNQPHSKVTWRGPYANNGKYAASRATVPVYPNCETNNVFSSGWPYVTHEAGGDTREITQAGTNLWQSHLGAQGSLSCFDLDYHDIAPNSDGKDQSSITVGLNTSLKLFFFYRECYAGNNYIIRIYPEWDKESYLASSTNCRTVDEVGQEIGGRRYDAETYTVPSTPGTYRVRVVYRGSSWPPTWDSYDRLLAEGTIVVKGVLSVTFDVQPRVGALVIDSTEYIMSQMPVSFKWIRESSHTFEVQPTISVAPDMRYVFRAWNDGITSNERVLVVSSSMSFVAFYDTGYLVSVSSPFGVPTGGGWYGIGDNVTVSVSPGKFRKDLFSDYVFESWKVSGTIVSTSPSYSFTVASPISLAASWKTELNLMIAGVAAVGAILAVAAVALFARRPKPSAAP